MSDLKALTKDLQKVFEAYGGVLREVSISYERGPNLFEETRMMPVFTSYRVTIEAEIFADTRPAISPPDKQYEIVRRDKS